MSKLMNSLLSLKSKLTDIEATVETTTTTKNKVITRDRNNKELLSKRIEQLKDLQKEKITIDCGGHLYSFSSTGLVNTLFPNIFSSMKDKCIFYDGNSDLFYYISLIIRDLTKENSDINKENPFKIVIKEEEDEVVLKEMIKEIFAENASGLLELVSISKPEKKLTNTGTTTTTNNENNAYAYDDNNNNNNAAYNYDRNNYSDY